MPDDLDKTIAMLEKLRENMVNVGPALQLLGPVLREQASQNFDTLGRHSGGRWSFDNEPKYRKRKRAIQGESLSRRPLWTRQDRLRRSYIQRSNSEHIERSRGNFFVFGTRVSYAAQLVKGGIGPLGERYPGRDPLAMTEQQRTQLQLLLVKLITPRGMK